VESVAHAEGGAERRADSGRAGEPIGADGDSATASTKQSRAEQVMRALATRRASEQRAPGPAIGGGKVGRGGRVRVMVFRGPVMGRAGVRSESRRGGARKPAPAALESPRSSRRGATAPPSAARTTPRGGRLLFVRGSPGGRQFWHPQAQRASLRRFANRITEPSIRPVNERGRFAR
jgi:hypothetical protein